MEVVSGSGVLRLVADDRADSFGVLFADVRVQSLGLSYDGLDSTILSAR